MKKINWATLLSAVLLLSVSCSDDAPNTSNPAVDAVKGNYSGNMTFTKEVEEPVVPMEDVSEALELTLTDKAIKFEAFPITGLVTAILGSASQELIDAIGAIKYEIPYTAKFNSDKSIVEMPLVAKPLELNLTIPDSDPVKITVEVEVITNGAYTIADKSLTFVIKATKVNLGEDPMGNFKAIELKFNVTKK